jgi:hypothetical protein
MTDLNEVRRLGVLSERIHAVVYFAPEPQQRYAALGLPTHRTTTRPARKAIARTCTMQVRAIPMS